MKKLIAITFMCFIATVSFAQKKELKAAEKAIKNSNFAQAKSLLGQVESLLSSADDKTKGKYYFLLGKALFANGAGSEADMGKAIESLSKSGKEFSGEAAEMKTSMINSFLTNANASLEQKDYAKSSAGFEKAYRLSPKDTLYLFYAASIAVNAQEYDSALTYYNELKDLGYSGVETQYVALDKESGEEEVFANKQLRDISVKTKTHIKPTDKKTEPRSAEIIKNIALIYVSQGNNEKAISAIADARKIAPNDLNLLMSEANVQYKMGNVDKYKSLIAEAVEMDPDNPELLYNLGVTSAETDPEAAKDFYKRAIALDPTYTNAYMNMAALTLADETLIFEEMNKLGSSASDDRKYDELKEKVNQTYRDAIPYLTKVLEMKPKNIDAAKTLMSIYSRLGDDVLHKEMKAKVESLENGGN